jgi:hypothetical protein
LSSSNIFLQIPKRTIKTLQALRFKRNISLKTTTVTTQLTKTVFPDSAEIFIAKKKGGKLILAKKQIFVAKKINSCTWAVDIPVKDSLLNFPASKTVAVGY